MCFSPQNLSSPPAGPRCGWQPWANTTSRKPQPVWDLEVALSWSATGAGCTNGATSSSPYHPGLLRAGKSLTHCHCSRPWCQVPSCRLAAKIPLLCAACYKLSLCHAKHWVKVPDSNQSIIPPSAPFFTSRHLGHRQPCSLFPSPWFCCLQPAHRHQLRSISES